MPGAMDIHSFRRRLAEAMSEAEIQQGIVKYLRATGWVVLEIKGNARRGGTVFQTKGIPDLYAVRKGRSLWLEVKRPGQRPRPEQEALHERLRQEGCEVHVIDGVEALERLL